MTCLIECECVCIGKMRISYKVDASLPSSWQCAAETVRAPAAPWPNKKLCDVMLSMWGGVHPQVQGGAGAGEGAG